MPKRINPNRILFEDEHLLAINKLNGELVVRGSGRVDRLPLLDFLRNQYGSNLKPIHRLDFETSGVVLFAKSEKCHEEAVGNKKFALSGLGASKIYRAIVMGRMKADSSGEINKPIPARSDGELVPARTKYKVLDSFRDASYVEAEIETGRQHQIRRHFASINHALVMDEGYGRHRLNREFQKKYGYKSFFLHAFQLKFKHFVTGESLVIEAPLLEVFKRALDRLSK